MDIELLKRLANADKETREVAVVVLEMAAEKDEIIGIADKINANSNQMIQEIGSLRMDKAALIAFIENNVADEELKKQILPEDNKGEIF